MCAVQGGRGVGVDLVGGQLRGDGLEFTGGLVDLLFQCWDLVVGAG